MSEPGAEPAVDRSGARAGRSGAGGHDSFSPPWRVALVHDWLTGMRGGEKVLEALCELFPAADLFTFVHVRGSVSPTIEARSPRTSFVQHLPAVARAYRHYLPLYPLAAEAFDLDGYDLVISTSHCAVKSVVTTGRTRHLCYCFTPMRYAWDQFDAYFGRDGQGWSRRALRPVLGALARWDAATSGRPDRYLAISQWVARRIERYYNRRSAVVYPPVDTVFFTPGDEPPATFALVVSALVPYKRIDSAIEACRLARLPLKIVGSGPEQARLARLAGPDVQMLGRLPDDQVRALYRQALAVLLPGEEDFGIVPVEAQACGRPVVALGAGGALETVIPGETGELAESPEPGAIADALVRAASRSWDPVRIRQHAERFSREHFDAGFRAAVSDLMTAPSDAVRW